MTFLIVIKAVDLAHIFFLIFVFENNNINFGYKYIALSSLIILANLPIRAFLLIKAALLWLT